MPAATASHVRNVTTSPAGLERPTLRDEVDGQRAEHESADVREDRDTARLLGV
jgi:hypothetical protein